MIVENVQEDRMKLLEYDNESRIMIDDEGLLWLLCHEQPEGESEIYRHSFSPDDFWDRNKGKTVVYFKTPLDFRQFVLRKESELPSGEMVYFYETASRFGSGIGDFFRYEFAIHCGKVVGYIKDVLTATIVSAYPIGGAMS
jgi:hypothetical protein